MLARIRKSMQEKDQGFTLIELLVVMIIIGILAAIAIPVFLNQRTKAQDTATKADASTVGKELATYFVDGSTTTAPTVAVASNRYQIAGGDVGAVTRNVTLGTATFATGAAMATTWCVPFTNSSTGAKSYVYTATAGLQEGTCAAGGVKAP